tara:strand:- start:1003 stop:1296 length:294 start_codon:yes stop_codon:yes gene_type:complete
VREARFLHSRRLVTRHALHHAIPPPSPLIFAGRGTEFLVKWYKVELSDDKTEIVAIAPHGKCIEYMRPLEFVKADAKYDIIDPPSSWATRVPLTLNV